MPTTIQEEKFWLIWSPSGSSGIFHSKHYSLETAAAEAENWAENWPGHKCYVLEAVAGKVTHPTDTIVFSGEDETQTEDFYSISSCRYSVKDPNAPQDPTYTIVDLGDAGKVNQSLWEGKHKGGHQ